MKIEFFTAAALAASLPIALAAPHMAGHHKFHVKKDLVTDIVTEYTTVMVPEYVVWVDNNGKPISTETLGGVTTSTAALVPISTPSTNPASSTTSVETPMTPTASSVAVALPPTLPAPTSSTAGPVTPLVPNITTIAPPATTILNTTSDTPAPTPSVTPAPTSSQASPARAAPQGTAGGSSDNPSPTDNNGGGSSTSSTSSTTQATTSANGGSTTPATTTPNGNSNNTQGTTNTNGAIFGIAYDILKGPKPGTCKTDSDVASDVAKFKGSGYNLIRIYATTCNQVAMVTKYAGQNNMSVFVSLSDLSTIPTILQGIIDQAGSNLYSIDTISVGNEFVNDGGSVSTVIAGLAAARTFLSGTNYTGNVVTVDTFDQLVANPDLCTNSDYCAANCHAYFTNTVTSSGAGKYVSDVAHAVARRNANKRVVITESGWPAHGAANGLAVASPHDQQLAIASLKAAFPTGDLIIFQAFDAQYKDPGPLGVEQYFGVYDDN